MMKHLASENSESELSVFEPEQIQPNAIDLKVAQVFEISAATFTVSEEEKVHRGSSEIPTDAEGYWTLGPGTYEIIMEGEITIGKNEAGFVITRSTLNRNGLFITSGLYDSGYSGVMAGALHVSCGVARIKRSTRVGQFLLFDAEAVNQYTGSYGSGSDHDAKYASGMAH